jgi:outer membrane protein TolC
MTMELPVARRIALTLVLTSLACVLFPGTNVGAQSPAQTLTLEQAINEALANNERMLRDQDSIEEAGLSVQMARNSFRPKLVPNVLGSFGTSDVANQSYRFDVSQRFTAGTEVRGSIGTSSSQIPSLDGSRDIRFYNADTTVTVTQPLRRGLGTTVGRRQLTSAEFRQDDARRQHVLSEQQVAFDVASSYYRLVAQTAFVEVAQKSLARARVLRDAAEAKLDAGLVSQLDTLRSQELVLQAQNQLLDAQAAVDDYAEQLAFVLGRDYGEPIAIARSNPRAASAPIGEDLVALALTRRLDLQRVTTAVADAELSVAVARNQLLPQVDVNFALTRRQTADAFARSFGLDGFRFATFFTIAMPVDRTPQLIEHQQSLIERDRRLREIQNTRRRITAEVTRAVRDRDRLARTVAAAQSSVDIATRESEVATFRYQAGLSNNLDVVSAETNLLDAESRRIAAAAESALAEINLRIVVGILDPRRDFAESPASQPPVDVVAP